MKIALVGGTGDIGTGLAIRWARENEIVIGSRMAERAKESASAVMKILGGDADIQGMDNGSAIAASEVAVLCVPYEHLPSVTSGLRSSYSGQLVISPVVPMRYSGRFFRFTPPAEGSAAMQARALLPEGTRIASAFHTIGAAALQDMERELEADVMVCSDDQEALDLVFELTRQIKSLRPLDAGPLEASSMVESLTPMLLNLAKRNRIRDPGIRVVSEH